MVKDINYFHVLVLVMLKDTCIFNRLYHLFYKIQICFAVLYRFFLATKMLKKDILGAQVAHPRSGIATSEEKRSDLAFMKTRKQRNPTV